MDRRPPNVGLAIVSSVVEHLVELDHRGELVPRLATGWQWFDERNWDEYHSFQEMPRAGAFSWTFPAESRLEILDPYTVQFVLSKPDSVALVRLAAMGITNRQFWRERAVAGYWGTYLALGSWGTGPYKWVEGYAPVGARPSPRIVLEANLAYWDAARLPRLQRMVFDNTLTSDEALALVQTSAGRVDLVADVRPLDTLRVAESPFAKVVKERGGLRNVFGLFNMHKSGSPWQDSRLRQAVNYAINREDFIRYATKGNGTIVPALLPPGAFGLAETAVTEQHWSVRDRQKEAGETQDPVQK